MHPHLSNSRPKKLARYNGRDPAGPRVHELKGCVSRTMCKFLFTFEAKLRERIFTDHGIRSPPPTDLKFLDPSVYALRFSSMPLISNCEARLRYEFF